jgi:hypothetical protein
VNFADESRSYAHAAAFLFKPHTLNMYEKYEKVEILFRALLNLAVKGGTCLYSGTRVHKSTGKQEAILPER